MRTMRRQLSWSAVGTALLLAFAARLLYLTWAYYFAHSPRYRLESAAVALIVVGLATVASRPGTTPPVSREPEPVWLMWLPVFLAAALALYYPALQLGLLSDDYVLRVVAMSPTLGIGSGWFVRPVPLLMWRLLLP